MASPLATRDANASIRASTASKDLKGNSTEANKQHKTTSDAAIERNGPASLFQTNNYNNRHYVSPSNAIMSPASQKLASMKARRLVRSVLSLPARTIATALMENRRLISKPAVPSRGACSPKPSLPEQRPRRTLPAILSARIVRTVKSRHPDGSHYFRIYA
jgi:Spo12 family